MFVHDVHMLIFLSVVYRTLMLRRMVEIHPQMQEMPRSIRGKLAIQPFKLLEHLQVKLTSDGERAEKYAEEKEKQKN